MKLAVLTPLPPVRSGIAHYNSMLLPELAKKHQVTVVVDQEKFAAPAGCPVIQIGEFDPAFFDQVIYHLGNNPFHEFVYVEAMQTPGLVVLHDFVLHHLIVESTLARGNPDAFIEQMRESHGAGGAALARGRNAGFHGEIGNFLYPASATVAKRSEGVIVHNRYAGESLRQLGVSKPITVVGHPHVPRTHPASREDTRAQLGFTNDAVVVGMFGFLTEAKRPSVVFDAFTRAMRRNPMLRLLVVGQPAPNVDVEKLAKNLPPSTFKALGFVEESQFDDLLAATDKVINLRYPSAGETSGALIRILAAGKPVAVSDYAQFTELPETIATRIPLGPGEVEALTEFLLQPSVSSATAQKEWLDKNATLEAAAADYERALSGANDIPASASLAPPTLPVLPDLRMDSLRGQRDGDRWTVEAGITNVGFTRLQAGVFGTPGYRVLAKVFENGEEIFDRWVELPKDLSPGDSTRIEFGFRSPAAELRVQLGHAIEGVPHFDLAPFGTAELRA